MLYFIPAWYQQNDWCENEQKWYARRMKSEFDDTVKHIQLFQRNKAYPYKILLLSFAPNFRHFLHRQGAFHAPYWSCFDSIQEIRRKKVKMFSFHNINWPEHIEFVYSPFVLMAFLNGEKYAQVEFGEDGNLIEIDMYQKDKLQRKNIYDDRGFVSSTIVYDNEKPVYTDYLNDKGLWKIRQFYSDGHIEVNPKCPVFLLEYKEQEYVKEFSKKTYSGMEELVFEVFNEYIKLTKEEDIFCAAMHELHINVLKQALINRKLILSFFSDRYNIKEYDNDISMIENANYIITDSRENLKRINKRIGRELTNITDITPFDSRVDFGISQQLKVQKILVPVDGMAEERFEELICELGKYLLTNDNARVHLFTRIADYDRKKSIIKQTRKILKAHGLEKEWASYDESAVFAENIVDTDEEITVKFFVDQCVDELSVSKCMREQRIIVDMRKNAELYVLITGISMGIPQIVYRDNQFVEDGKNGIILKDMSKISEALAYYLENLTNWNEAVVYSYELGKKYTVTELLDKWKEVIDFVGSN